MGEFDGKVALITGAARGQGRSHAMALAREGASVALLDIANGEMTHPPARVAYGRRHGRDRRLVEAEGGKALAVACDVRDEEQVIVGRGPDGRDTSAASTSSSPTPASSPSTSSPGTSRPRTGGVRSRPT